MMQQDEVVISVQNLQNCKKVKNYHKVQLLGNKGHSNNYVRWKNKEITSKRNFGHKGK